MQNLRWLALLATIGWARAEQPVTVATWNLHWFPGGAPKADAMAVAEHIHQIREGVARLGADILLLQEIADWDTAQDHVAGPSGLTLHVVSRFPVSPQMPARSRQQLAILSRFEALASWSQAWETASIEPPRGFCFAALRVGGAPLLVYTVHLKSNAGDPDDCRRKREESVAQLCQHIAAMKLQFRTDRVIVGGDFNTDLPGLLQPDEDTLGTLVREGLFWTFHGIPREARLSWLGNGSYPPASLDHIFCSGLGRPVAEILPLDGSDHLPVRATISIQISPPASPLADTRRNRTPNLTPRKPRPR